VVVPSSCPAAHDYLKLFLPYHGASSAEDFGAVYLESEHEGYRLLFEQVCRLLVLSSPFNQAMPPEFRRTARLYLAGDRVTLEHMRRPEMRHFMLSDLYDYVHLCSRAGQAAW
jgi:hypothetical protein